MSIAEPRRDMGGEFESIVLWLFLWSLTGIYDMEWTQENISVVLN